MTPSTDDVVDCPVSCTSAYSSSTERPRDEKSVRPVTTSDAACTGSSNVSESTPVSRSSSKWLSDGGLLSDVKLTACCAAPSSMPTTRFVFGAATMSPIAYDVPSASVSSRT